MACIHHYSIIQSIFTDPKVLRTPVIHHHPPPTPGTIVLFTVSTVFFQGVIQLGHTVWSLFWLVLSLSIMNLRSLSFHILITHFFLALNNTPLTRYTTVYLSTPLLKDILAVSKFRQLWINTCADFCVGISFQLLWVNTKEHNCWTEWLCEKLPNYFPKWLYHAAFLPAMNKSFFCSTSSPAFGVVSGISLFILLL